MADNPAADGLTQAHHLISEGQCKRDTSQGWWGTGHLGCFCRRASIKGSQELRHPQTATTLHMWLCLYVPFVFLCVCVYMLWPNSKRREGWQQKDMKMRNFPT